MSLMVNEIKSPTIIFFFFLSSINNFNLKTWKVGCFIQKLFAITKSKHMGEVCGTLYKALHTSI